MIFSNLCQKFCVLYFWIRTTSLEDSIDVDFDGWGKERLSDDG
jgi:hypothetical protein